jgi:pimeloyl-ACP methyl ester carboxylesterase
MAGTPEFYSAYDAVLAQWPAGVESVDVPTSLGTTRVQVCGDGPPLLLLHGGGATSTVWFALASELAASYRIYAPDLVGDPGRSVPERRLRSVGDFVEWLDGVLDGLALDETALCGHSYGGWIATCYALSRPGRINRLALLDAANVFVPMAPRYLVHGVPVLLSRSPTRLRRFLAWETAARPLDPAWLRTAELAKTGRWHRPVAPKVPKPECLRALVVPTLVLLAEHTRTHDIRRVEALARELVPDVTVAVLPGATHHTLPTEDAPVTAAALRSFL